MKMMPQHTVRTFDVELDDLSGKIAEMGRLVQKQVAGSMTALAKRDIEIARDVAANRDTVDALHREIQESGIVTIARRQPVAGDLREIVGASRIAHDLEHIGDLAENVAKRVIKAEDKVQLSDVVLGVEHMGELVLGQLSQVIDSYIHRDAAKALEVWRKDAQIDSVYNSLFRELLTYMMEDPHRISYCTHLLLSIKNIERMGDHATNVAESVYYIIEGCAFPEERSRGDTTEIAAVQLTADPESASSATDEREAPWPQ
jgi:phosphate transport system protein